MTITWQLLAKALISITILLFNKLAMVNCGICGMHKQSTDVKKKVGINDNYH